MFSVATDFKPMQILTSKTTRKPLIQQNPQQSKFSWVSQNLPSKFDKRMESWETCSRSPELSREKQATPINGKMVVLLVIREGWAPLEGEWIWGVKFLQGRVRNVGERESLGGIDRFWIPSRWQPSEKLRLLALKNARLRDSLRYACFCASKKKEIAERASVFLRLQLTHKKEKSAQRSCFYGCKW